MKKEYDFKNGKRGAVVKERKDPRIEVTYYEDVTFTCPVRGQVTQKVKIKRFKQLGDMTGKHVIVSSDSIDELEKNDDGLSIYNDGEPLDIVGPSGNSE